MRSASFSGLLFSWMSPIRLSSSIRARVSNWSGVGAVVEVVDVRLTEDAVEVGREDEMPLPIYQGSLISVKTNLRAALSRRDR